MSIKLSGLNSGMDTESIIQELVKAKSDKKIKLEGQQKKLEWKQEAWKELNSKIYALYSKTLSNMRLQSDYTKKVTKTSSDAVSVVTGANTPNGVQTLKVKEMATSGYLTGGKLADKSGTYTSSSKVKDIIGTTEDTSFFIQSGDTKKEIEITDETTIKDVLSAMKAAGVNANFDEENQRFYISAKSSGDANDFSISADDDNGLAAMTQLGLSTAEDADKKAVKIDGQDAEIELNGVTYTSDKNTFSINDMTITVNNRTDEEITLTTADDTDGIYDMIKNFFKEYNELINEMDKLYNADSASKYEMLTDEEREAISEDEAEEWDNKIKSALLRRDSQLGTVFDSMKMIMLEGVKMSDGSKMYLSDFGIATLGYFSAEENERNAYHIDGDEDDESTCNNTDKLKAAIAADPAVVAEFFSGLTRNLYERLDDLMARTELSSAFTVYNDKSLEEEYNNYKEKIADQEEKIADFEDRYYDQFTQMEVAMSKLNSQQSAISSLFSS